MLLEEELEELPFFSIFLNDSNQMNNIYKFNDDTVNDINNIKSMFENMETMNWAFCLGLLQFINKTYK